MLMREYFENETDPHGIGEAYPVCILQGEHNGGHNFRVLYDKHYATCGIPAYFVHRARYVGDKLKRQVKPFIFECESLFEPNVILGGPLHTERGAFEETYFADVVFAETFQEVITFLAEPIMTPFRGKDWQNYCQWRKEVEAEMAKEWESEKASARREDFQLELKI